MKKSWEMVVLVIIFTKTKTMTIELAEKLSARGFSAEAINGDIQQTQRERIINNYKKKKRRNVFIWQLDLNHKKQHYLKKKIKTLKIDCRG
jgi:superfamily II DNA/RNA helicase